MGRATIADVANKAGVSTATVSRVLTGSGKVSDDLRDKVQAAVNALDYSANTAARALRRDRTSTVGMIVPDLSNPFFTILVDRVERGLQSLGFSLHLCSSSNDADLEARRIRSLRQARVAGLIVIPTHVVASGPALREAAAEVPVVQLDQFADGVDTDWVGVDEREGVRLIFDHLSSQGTTSVAYVGGTVTDSSARVRLQAVADEARNRGIVLEPSRILLNGISIEWGATAAHMLAQADLPDAVVCGADVVALGVLQGFDALGVRVPEDVLVTGYDDIPLSSHSRLSITTVRQPVDEIAARAVEILTEAIDAEDGRTIRREAIPPGMVVRSSSQRVPDRNA